jgi:hypothetical protein
MNRAHYTNLRRRARITRKSHDWERLPCEKATRRLGYLAALDNLSYRMRRCRDRVTSVVPPSWAQQEGRPVMTYRDDVRRYAGVVRSYRQPMPLP